MITFNAKAIHLADVYGFITVDPFQDAVPCWAGYLIDCQECDWFDENQLGDVTREQSKLMIENMAEDLHAQGFKITAKLLRDMLQAGTYHDLALIMRGHVLWLEGQKRRKQKGTVFAD